MEKGSQERFSIVSPWTFSNSSSKRHEIFRYNQWVKILVPLKRKKEKKKSRRLP